MAEEEGESGPLSRRWATWALVALNGSVFLAMVLAGASPLFTSPGDAMAAGGVDPVRVWNGEVWRLLTACFVHLGIWHLALNMWVLVQLGAALERMIGGARLLLVYLSSGVFGFALSVAVAGKQTAGASGAVFGVTGALLALALLLRHRELGRLLFSALLPFVVATLVLGFLVPMVDNSAHVGGLLFGFALCYGLSAGDRAFLAGHGDGGAMSGAAARRERRLGAIVLVASAVLFVGVVAYGARPVLSPRYQVKAGLEALQSKRLDEARAHARSAARIAPDDGVTFVLLGRIRGETATSDAERAEGSRLLEEALKRFDDKEPAKALGAAEIELGLLGGGTAELPYNDPKTVDALCDATLALLDNPAGPGPRAGPTPAPEVKNECAWLKLKAADATVHDPAAALGLARAAVRESEGKDANIVHTLAEALAQTGDPEEGLAILERLAAEGREGELPGGADFLASERRRVKRLVEEKAEATRGAVPVVPPPAGADAAPQPALGLP